MAWDLFLGGAGAGAYLVGVVAEWLGGRFRRLAKPGIYAGPIMVAVGALLLLIELGRPLRFWRGFLRPGNSMMSVGIILISVFIVLGFLHILFSLFPRIGVKAGVLRWLGIVNAVIGVGVILYTGLLLGLVKAVPFWNTPLLPLLFLVSALLCGLATVMLIVGLWRWVMPAQVGMEEVGESFRSLIPLVLVLVVVEVLMLFSHLLVMGGGQVTAAESARYLVGGGYATAFWVGLVVVGLLVPLGVVIWVVARRREKVSGLLVDLTTLAAFCLLVGGLILRYAVVAAGASLALTL